MVKSKQLLTQKDGRRFAVEVLQRLQNMKDDRATVVPFDPSARMGDQFSPALLYRSGPQMAGFFKDLLKLRNASEEAVKGFASVFTDCFGGSVNMDLDAYRRWDQAGLMQDFGQPGSAMKSRMEEIAKANALIPIERWDAGERGQSGR